MLTQENKQLQLEVVSREQSFNMVFKQDAAVGVMNPLGSSTKINKGLFKRDSYSHRWSSHCIESLVLISFIHSSTQQAHKLCTREARVPSHDLILFHQATCTTCP